MQTGALKLIFDDYEVDSERRISACVAISLIFQYFDPVVPEVRDLVGAISDKAFTDTEDEYDRHPQQQIFQLLVFQLLLRIFQPWLKDYVHEEYSKDYKKVNQNYSLKYLNLCRSLQRMNKID